MTSLEELKIILREEQSPFFSDTELSYYIEKNENDVEKAAYTCFLLKAEDDSIQLPGGLSLPNNRSYWLSLAKKYRHNGSCVIKGVGEK